MIKKLISLSILIILLLSFSSCSPQYQRFQTEFTGPFDTATVIIGYAQSEADFARHANAIFDRISELHILFDIFNEYQGINNIYTINANAGISPVEVDREIIDMLLYAREGYELSGGLVDITLGPVLRIWHRYRMEFVIYGEQHAMPSYEELREAAEFVGMQDLIIDAEMNTVFLQREGMSLDVGSIAKGYAVGLVADMAREAGLTSAILNVGGHVVTIGSPQGGNRDTWNIGVQNPELGAEAGSVIDTVRFNDMVLSISGGYQRFFVVDNVAYNHIIDPRTLMPASRYKQVAVIHEDSTLADILSLALFIMPFEEGYELAREYGAKALWIDIDGEWEVNEGYAEISTVSGSH